jgi:hypothetical protein
MAEEGQLVQEQNGTEHYRDSIKTTARLVVWTLAWVATLALARFGPGLWWESQPVASWGAVAANLVVGVVWVVAWMRFLRVLDELQRKILQDALAVTLGVGWVGGFGYVVADAAGLIAHDVDIAVFPVLLAVAYLIAFAVGKIRFR